jgi:integrase
MRRKRFQKGSVQTRRHGRVKVWVAQWWEDGSRRSKVLGKCSELTRAQAEVELATRLNTVNASAGHQPVQIYTFEKYLEDVFLPTCRRKWKESTRMTSEQIILTHLNPAFGPKLMGTITREEMQVFLDEKAQSFSFSVVGHLRWHLSSIFRMAMSDGIVRHNPAAGLFTPACKAHSEKRVMTKEQIRTALNALELRQRLILRMAVFDGMRPGEILAIRLGNLKDHSVHIDQRVYRGNLDTPKGRKGKRTARTVALSPGTVTDLQVWKSCLQDQGPDALLFPSEAGTPLSRDNLWRRMIAPKLEAQGLAWANFQVMRRTNASLSHKAKIDSKVAADQRGHGLGVSLEVYTVSDLEQKIAAVTRLESEVIQTAKRRVRSNAGSQLVS